MFLLYSVLFTLVVILTAPYYVWRRGGRGSLASWRERLGLLTFQETEPGSIWVHAVSVGETLEVVGLVRELQELYPGRKIYMSHATPAGREAGEVRLRGLAGRFYVPLDWRWTARRVLGRLRPALLLIVETELWPNLLRAAHESRTRVILVNARVSERSYRGYRLIRPFMRRVLESIDRVCAQSAQHAERFRVLGARPERVVVVGNLKFDAVPPRGQGGSCLKQALTVANRKPVIVAASTMRGEEPLLLEAWREILGAYPRALLLLAPRHPVRFEAVAELLTQHAKSFLRRTALPADETGAALLATPEILLLDTIGELAGIFELADAVFVGGSLVPTGGHNPLEPAFWARPILFGPHMENFSDIVQLFLDANAAVQVRDAHELSQAILKLLEDEPRRRQLGETARRVLEQHSGATQRILEYVKDALGERLAVG